MPWSLYLALKQLFPTRRISFFTLISLAGVAVGVMLLIVSISVMGGFGREIRRMIVDTQGEVQVRAPGYIANPVPLLKAIAETPGVVAVTPFAEGAVLIEYRNAPVYPAIQGIDLQRVESVTPLKRYIVQGSLDDLDDDSVILSAALARQLRANLGSVVEVTSPLLVERLQRDEIMLPRELTVVGIFEIGHQQLDSSLVLVSLRRMQELYGLGDGIHGVNVKIAPDADPDLVAREINTHLPLGSNAWALSWMSANQDFLFVIQLEKNLIFFLLLFIVIVAAFSVTSSLLIAVVRKTREIGLLGALGADRFQIAACFCWQGLIIGVSGTALGLGLGFAALHFRNDAIRVFTQLTSSQEALERFYQFSNLPAYLSRQDLALITVLSVVISSLAGVVPAWRAARLKPVEALRHE